MGWGQNVNDEEHQEVSELKYLGPLVTCDNYCGSGVRDRITAGTRSNQAC